MLTPENENILRRGVLEVIDEKHLELRLGRSRPLRVKLGIDPTGHHLHLGHAVALRKLAAFQNAGHTAVLIIGDYTARVGDPSGKDETRRALSEKEVKDYAANYLDQAARVIDIRRVEVRYNSEWLGRMKPDEFIRLLQTTTVNKMLSHETFRRRLDQGLPLSLHELTYPLLQGYDSFVVEADLELGAQEQKFNLLAGREVQRAYGQEPQDIMLLEYLIGTDGKKKMGKTEGNFIALEDVPEDMFGKIMSIPDKLVAQYFQLATGLDETEIASHLAALKKKKAKARDTKIFLAKTIVTELYDAAAADQASREFTQVFSHRGAPSSMPSIPLKPGNHQIINLLMSHQLVASRSEGRRLIEQGGIKIDGRVIEDWEATVDIKDGSIIQIGKRKFVKAETT